MSKMLASYLCLFLTVFLLLPVANANPAALDLMKQEKYEEVISLLKSQADNLDSPSLLILAKAYNKTHDYLNEFRVLSNLVTVDEKNYAAHTAIGFYHIRNKDLKKAGESFRQALGIKKDYRPAYDGLIDVYTQRNNNYELRQIYTDMLNVFGQKSEIISQLCKLHSKENLFETAIEFCNKGIRLQPSNPSNHVYLALVLHSKGDKKQATKILKRAADKFKLSDLAQLSYAEILFKDSNFAVAEKYYSAAMKANPKSPDAARGAAANFIELKKYEEALATFKIACSLDPHNTIKDIRKANNTIRRANLNQWDSKFTAAAENCTR